MSKNLKRNFVKIFILFLLIIIPTSFKTINMDSKATDLKSVTTGIDKKKNTEITEEPNEVNKEDILTIPNDTPVNENKTDKKVIKDEENINTNIDININNDIIDENKIGKEIEFIITKSIESLTNKAVKITINTDSNNLVSFNNEEYSLNKTVVISENFTNYSIKVKDLNNKIKEEKINITNIDKIKPILNYTQNIKEITTNDVVISLTSSDNVSLPVNKYSYNYGDFTSNSSYTFKRNVDNFSIRVIDSAGNITEELISITNINREKTIKEKNEDLIDEIRNTYGFDIEYGSDTHFWFDGSSCVALTDENKVNTALNSLKSKLSLFPTGFFYMFQGKNGYSVLLVDDIPGEVAGVATSEMPGDNQLVLDVNTDFLGRTFYHETFHLIDYLIDYMYRGKSNHPFKNWNSLNDTNFSYGNTDNNSFTIYDNNISKSEMRFITAYSKKSDKEDRAEIFADLMFRPYRHYYMADGYGLYEKAKYLVNVLNNIWINNSNAGWNRWVN